MPVYEVSSPHSGRTYDVDFNGEPTQQDAEYAATYYDQLAAQREAEKAGFSFGDALSGIGDAVGGLRKTLPAAYYRLTEGMARPDTYSHEARAAFDAESQYARDMQQESQNRLLRGEASSTGDAFRSAGPSLGFSAGSMAAAVPVGIAGGLAGAKVGGMIGTAVEPGGGTAAGGVLGFLGGAGGAMVGAGSAAYRMAGAQFLDDAFKTVGEQRAARGEPWDDAAKEQAYRELLPLAQDSALWEAGPEAIGNAVGLGAGKIVLGLGKPVLAGLVKSALGKFGLKAGALATGVGTELATETATQIGQGLPQAQADAYARGQPMSEAVNPYDRPGGLGQALSDIAPQTLALSALMLGGGAAVKAGTLPFRGKQQEESAQSPSPTVSPSPSPQQSTLARIAAESVAPEEDSGAFSAQDLESDPNSAVFQPLAVPPSESARAPLPFPQPILQGLGQPMSDPLLPPLTPDESAPADKTVPDAIQGVIDEPQTITGSNVQMGTEMPVPPPTVQAGAGAGMVAAQDPASAQSSVLSAQNSAQPIVTAATLVRDTIHLDFDALARKPSLEELRQTFPGAMIEEMVPDVSSGTKGVVSFRVIGLNENGSMSSKAASELYQKAFGTTEKIRTKSKFQQMGSLQERFAAGQLVAGMDTMAGLEAPAAAPLKNLNVNGSTAGFANAQILAEAADLIRQGFNTFANWSKAMLTRFGRGIRDYLAGIWQQVIKSLPNTAAQNVRMGRAQGTAPLSLPNSGAVVNPFAKESAIPEGMAETQARWASPNQEDNLYETEPVEVAKDAGVSWLNQTDTETALRYFESATVPGGMTQARMFYAHGELLSRLAQQTQQGTEAQRLRANSFLNRAGRAWHGRESQEWGRAGKARAVVSDELKSLEPILAAQEVLTDRAEAVVKQRFTGGGEGVKTKIEKILADADMDITERVERILATVMQSALKPITSIKDAVAALMSGKSQREQMIEDVAQALMTKARGNVVTPERKTALAALAASLKQTLGASVQGDAKQAAASPLGEVLARAFVDQVSEAKLFTEAWEAGRQSVFEMFYDMELDKAYTPARMRAEQAQARLKQLEAGSADQLAGSAAERADLKTTLEGLRAEMQQAKDKADGMTDAFWKQVAALMPATPTMAYAPGMSKEAVKRGFEAAGYTADVKTGMKADGTRTLNVRDALRDPQRAMTAVLNVWDAEAQAAGIDPAAWQEGRKLAWQALNETMTEWQKKADERAAKLAQAQKDALMAKDSPALVKLLKAMAGKIAPGMSWTEIFTDLQGTQKERQLAIYARLLKHENLQSLTQDERIALTNELDRAWMRERRTVFNRELQKAGILGEKSASDRLKVKNAMPKLLRLINLGMFNSEMFREVIAPEYKLRVIDAKTAGTLRGLAEAAYKEPEGVLRARKLGALLNAMQAATGSTLAELVNNYWTAAVLSGTRTQFDTWMAGLNGLGTNMIQAAGLLARGRGKAAVQAHAAWWRGLIDGTRESLQILAKGDYSVLKRFGTDLNRALDGESGFRPLPLGESLWKNGNTFQKYAMAPVMIWTGRLMAAADHINNTATTAGAMAVARALHPEYYGRTTFTATEQANARAQALREVTGGTESTNAADKATVSVRVRELLYGSMRETERLEANMIGDMAAFQNDPTGLFGGVYAMLKGGLGFGQRLLEGEANDMEANKAYRAAMGLMAGSLHGLTGTRFMRFGFNFGAELTRYVPGTALLDMAASRKLYGKDTGPMQRELLIGKNMVGLMLGSTLAALFLSGDDDDKGLQIEGDWSGLTPQQVKERMSAGYERMSIRWRDGDTVRRISYKQWPTMGLFAVVGGMLDEKRHKPAQWAQHGTTGHLIRGMGTGMLQIKNVSAIRNLVELFGGTRFGGDPSAAMIEDVLKVGTNFAGGMIPTVLKDAEIWTDPRNFKPDGWNEELIRSMPIARRFVNDGRPQLNLLGEEVKLQRAPWSRGYTSVESGEAGRVLGALLGRGLALPQPSDDVMVYQNGVKVPLEKLGREKVWQYEKAVGTAYKQWLATEGAALLQMPVKQADKAIDRRATAIKRQALARVTR